MVLGSGRPEEKEDIRVMARKAQEEIADFDTVDVYHTLLIPFRHRRHEKVQYGKREVPVN